MAWPDLALQDSGTAHPVECRLVGLGGLLP